MVNETLFVELLWILAGLLALFLAIRILPGLFIRIKNWAEKFIARTVTDIVNSFWEQQSKRLQESRRQKKNKKKNENDKKMRSNLADSIILDTSVLIDGRILDIVKTGFLNNTLIVPKAVLNELHLISDSDETLKRQKGRRGLDMIKSLKEATKVIIFNPTTSENEVDKELINIAKKYKIRLMTLDYNLNKVATVSGVKVLNINELVNAVKTVVIPGETLKIKLVQEGKEKNQGVGYMPDGTMIVVEGAKEMVGKDVEVKVARVIQTNAGKMIFCSLS
jgi:uncharacterized protein YacL